MNRSIFPGIMLTAVLSLAICGPVFAQCSIPASIGGSGGLSNGLDIDGGYAFSIEHGRLTSFDISDPANLHPVGTLLLSQNFLWDVKVDNGIAVCADAFWGVRIADVSNPAAPFYLSTYDTPYGPESVAIAGNIVYAADGQYSVKVIDISEPAAPFLRSSISTSPRYAQEVVLVDTTLYIGCESYGQVSLQVANVSNPSAPVGLGSLVLSPGYPVGLSDLDVSGTTAFLSETRTGLHIIDCSNPPALVEVGSLGDPTGAVKYYDSRLLLGRGGPSSPSVDVVDISNPNLPVVVSNVLLPGPVDDIAIAGNLAILGCYDAGLTTLDLSDPDAPVVIGTSGTADSPSDVVVSGGLAYVADGRFGLKVLDPANPMVPAPIGAVATPGFATGIHVAGTVAYIAAAEAGLVTVDVSDPEHPALLGLLDTPGIAVEVAVAGGRAYIADGTQGLHVADVSNPAAPSTLGSIVFPGVNAEATSVFVAGNLAYLTDRFYGLRIVDVTDPEALSLLSTTDTYSYAFDVVVDGIYAFVSDQSYRLYVMNVSNPYAPTILWSGASNGSGKKIALAGGTLFLSQGQGGYMETYDVTNPSAPFLLSSVGAPTLGNGLSYWNGFVLAAHWYNGLRTFRADGLPYVVGPQDDLVCEGSDASLYVAAAGQDSNGADPPTLQWRKEGVNLVDGPTGTGSTIAGSATPALTILNVSSADQGGYDCVVTNPCGETFSSVALLTVIVGECCPGDVDGDGNRDLDDVSLFVTCMAGPDAPNPGCDPEVFDRGDLDEDGDMDLADFLDIQLTFGQACP